MSLAEIIRPIVPQLDQVEEQLKGVGNESEGILKDSCRYVLAGGGKRLRSALVFFCASIRPAANGNGSASAAEESSLEVATAVELIHSATLVHDDIIDRAAMRRLRPTAGVQFGDEVAVLLGDFLYARAFSMIAKVGDEKITSWMAETTEAMCEGEIDQLKHRYRADLPLEKYLSFIEKKTATLISVSARAGAKLGGLSVQQQDALAFFGLNIGISYQIVDDLLDVVGSENRLGKTLHSDVYNGKMTLPMILLMGDMTPDEKKKFLEDFQVRRPDWQAIQSLLDKYKIVERTGQAADLYFERAMQAIGILESPVRQSLENLSRFILKRDY